LYVHRPALSKSFNGQSSMSVDAFSKQLLADVKLFPQHLTQPLCRLLERWLSPASSCLNTPMLQPSMYQNIHNHTSQEDNHIPPTTQPLTPPLPSPPSRSKLASGGIDAAAAIRSIRLHVHIPPPPPVVMLHRVLRMLFQPQTSSVCTCHKPLVCAHVTNAFCFRRSSAACQAGAGTARKTTATPCCTPASRSTRRWLQHLPLLHPAAA